MVLTEFAINGLGVAAAERRSVKYSTEAQRYL